MFEGILQPMDLLTILVIAVLVFGPKSFSGLGGGPTSGNGPKGGSPQHPLPVTGPLEKALPQKDQSKSRRVD
jgi:hypothetical protein